MYEVLMVTITLTTLAVMWYYNAKEHGALSVQVSNLDKALVNCTAVFTSRV